jgi:hypothetical protein
MLGHQSPIRFAMPLTNQDIITSPMYYFRLPLSRFVCLVREWGRHFSIVITNNISLLTCEWYLNEDDIVSSQVTCQLQIFHFYKKLFMQCTLFKPLRIWQASSPLIVNAIMKLLYASSIHRPALRPRYVKNRIPPMWQMYHYLRK